MVFTALVRDRLECDPTNGHLYLFANSRRDRMKILDFDGSSLWVCARRMEGGRLRWPEAEGGQVQLAARNLRCFWAASICVRRASASGSVAPWARNHKS
jgi:transposase